MTTPKRPSETPTQPACPRCAQSFVCGAVAGHCDCFDIALSAQQQAAIAARFEACLCVPCLRQIAQGAAVAPA